MALGLKEQLPCHQRLGGFGDVYRRMAWDMPPPTITGGCINPSKGRFLHPQANRAITQREAALLQTFPKTYRFSVDRGRYPVALLESQVWSNAASHKVITRFCLGCKKRPLLALMHPPVIVGAGTSQAILPYTSLKPSKSA